MSENEHPYGTVEYVKAKIEEGKRMAREHADNYKEPAFTHDQRKRYEASFYGGYLEGLAESLALQYESLRNRVQELTRNHDDPEIRHEGDNWQVLTK